VKAITVLQPFAELIACGEKRVENRTWLTHHRGPLAIHAGLSRRMLGDGHDAMAFGAIVAVAELVECLPLAGARQRRIDDDPLAWLADHPHVEGPWCWVLAGVRRLAEPIACPGRRRLWGVPPDIARQLI
jgi:hypothetical protein